jgi:signal transduction histidine kinase
MKKAAPLPTTLRAMNEALVLGSLRQHELTDVAETLIVKLQDEMDRRQRVEAALRKIEGSYHDMFNAIDEAFCIIEKIGIDITVPTVAKTGKTGKTGTAKPAPPSAKPALSDYRYIQVNPAFAIQSGFKNVVGKTIRQLIQGEAQGWCAIYDAILKTGTPQRFERTLEKTGCILELYAFRVEDETHRRVAVLFKDITRRKKVEQSEKRLAVLSATNKKLEREIVRREAVEKVLVHSERHEKQLRVRTRQLAQQVLHSQEEERLRISRELHDQVVQTLIGINVRLVGLKQHAGKLGPTFRQQLAIAQNLVETSVETVHGISKDLRPDLLDFLGFIPSIKALLKTFQEDTGVRVNLTVFAGVENLDDAIRTGLYRVLQEALSNISRHAHATKVEIRIEKDAKATDRIRMTVQDNGKGPEKDSAIKPKKKTSLGIVGMQERIEILGGTFTIRILKGKGTTVTVQIPLTD